jgi:prevent-host-death family protein
MQIITSVEAQNNFGKLMNTIPREPVIITKHGKNYAIVLPYEEPVEFGEIDLKDLSKETRDMYERSLKLDKSAFINF